MTKYERSINERAAQIDEVKRRIQSKVYTLAIDTETTGLDADAEILQLSIMDSNGNVLWNQYYYPEHHLSWDDAQKIHKISPEDVANAPLLSEDLPLLQALFDSCQNILGYNVGYDIARIEHAGIVLKDDIERIDVMKDFALIYGEWNEHYNEYKWKSLNFCREYHQIPLPEDAELHDSLTDIRMTLRCHDANCHTFAEWRCQVEHLKNTTLGQLYYKDDGNLRHGHEAWHKLNRDYPRQTICNELAKHPEGQKYVRWFGDYAMWEPSASSDWCEIYNQYAKLCKAYRLYVDMDGTLAEWKNLSTSEQLYEPGYFRNLQPNPNIVTAIRNLINDCDNIDVYVLSHVLPDSSTAKEEKLQWLAEWLPELSQDKVIFTPCGIGKHQAIERRYSDLLLDDYTSNLLSWEKESGSPRTARAIKCYNGINGTQGKWHGNGISYNWTPERIEQHLINSIMVRDLCEEQRTPVPVANIEALAAGLTTSQKNSLEAVCMYALLERDLPDLTPEDRRSLFENLSAAWHRSNAVCPVLATSAVTEMMMQNELTLDNAKSLSFDDILDLQEWSACPDNSERPKCLQRNLQTKDEPHEPATHKKSTPER